MNRPTYKNSGVDVAAAAKLVERIRPLARTTLRPGAAGDLGGFGGLFDLGEAGFDNPILVAATDGVGTKLRLAIDTQRHRGVGIDLVAMCVNDLVVQGAVPLFFLDYFATGHLESDVVLEVIDGIADGCRLSGCALIGGETAEMPGMYARGDFDLAGFAVGAVGRENLLPRKNDMASGDILLGLESSGIHSNGFSLIRHVLDTRETRIEEEAPFSSGRSWADELLEPTRIYTAACLEAHQEGMVKGFAHITGGGLIENIPRALPDNCSVVLEPWPLPPVFRWLADEASIPIRELVSTFNCGIGMVVITSPACADAVTERLIAMGEEVRPIGHIVLRDVDASVSIDALEVAWNA